MARVPIKKYVAKNGKTTYRVVYDLPPDPVSGKRRQKWMTAPTKKEAEKLLAKVTHEVTTGTYIDSNTAPLRDYLTEWLAGVESSVWPSTYVRYRDAVRRHIVPALGNVLLGKLTGAHIQRFYAAELAAGLSPTTVELYHMVLHRALEQAVKWSMIVYNPCNGVDVPRHEAPETKTWTAEQARAFLTGTADDDLAALWRLALTTGARKGELLALRWQDIDLDRGTLAIRRTLSRGKDGLGFNDPKSSASKRTFALLPSCVAALKRHKAHQNERRLRWGDAWQEIGLVFDRGDGSLLHPNVAYVAFKRHARRLELPVIRFHDLRHTCATLAMADGVHAKVVQERLGHSTIGITLDRYSHVTVSMQQDASDRLERLLES